MPRHYYCSNCGMELILKRKSLKNKQVIIDTLDPHTCDEEKKNLDNVTDYEQPLTAYQKEIRDSNQRIGTVHNDDDLVFQDQRDKKFLRDNAPLTSTAPMSVLTQIKGVNLRPENLLPNDDEA